MVLFRTVQANLRGLAKMSIFASILGLSSVLTHADSNQAARILSISDLEEASLVTINGGYDLGFRNGMKLIAHNEDGIAAELIVLDVTENETQTLIIELFGQAPLKAGNPVTIKTINFAAKWK